MYGSSLRCVTSRPRFSISAPIDDAASPFPSELTTPPVTNRYFVFFVRFTMALPPRSGPHQHSARPLQVLRRVDAEAAVARLHHPHPMPVLQRPQLLERLLLLEP